MICKKGALRNLAKFTGKHLCQNLFFNIVVGLRPATLLKKILWHMCFPVNFVKEHLRTPLVAASEFIDFQNNCFVFYFHHLEKVFGDTSSSCTKGVSTIKVKIFGKVHVFQKRLLSP